jgi:DNA-directed RNA polymerase subunit RPC12/RpoP
MSYENNISYKCIRCNKPTQKTFLFKEKITENFSVSNKAIKTTYRNASTNVPACNECKKEFEKWDKYYGPESWFFKILLSIEVVSVIVAFLSIAFGVISLIFPVSGINILQYIPITVLIAIIVTIIILCIIKTLKKKPNAVPKYMRFNFKQFTSECEVRPQGEGKWIPLNIWVQNSWFINKIDSKNSEIINNDNTPDTSQKKALNILREYLSNNQKKVNYFSLGLIIVGFVLISVGYFPRMTLFIINMSIAKEISPGFILIFILGILYLIIQSAIMHIIYKAIEYKGIDPKTGETTNFKWFIIRMALLNIVFMSPFFLFSPLTIEGTVMLSGPIITIIAGIIFQNYDLN